MLYLGLAGHYHDSLLGKYHDNELIIKSNLKKITKI